jgi:hypothetical protein
MREKAKELQRQKIEMSKRGGGGGRPMSNSGGFGVGQMNSGGFSGGPSIGDSLSTPAEPPKPTYSYPS